MKELLKRMLAFTLVVITSSIWAQSTEKLNERFNVNKDVQIDIDTRHADVIFETWNKNEVVVEAFVEGEGLTNEQLEKAASGWDLNVSGNSKSISIRSSTGNHVGFEDVNLGGIDEIIAGSLGIVEPIMDDIVGPLLEGLTGSALPAEFYDELDKIEFDHESYRKEGRTYLKRYEKQVEKSFGPDFDKAIKDLEKEIEENFDQKSFTFLGGLKDIPRWPFGKSKSMNFNSDEYEKDKKAYVNKLNKKYGTKVTVRETDEWLEGIEAWGEQFGEDMERWGENFGESFEIWGEAFGKRMEDWGDNFGEKIGEAIESWGENFGEDMEKWGEDFGKRMEKWAEEHEADWERTVEEDENGNKKPHIRLNHSINNSGSMVKRTIKVKIPKNAELDLNVRHGKVKMASLYNPKMNITHGSLVAETIDGGETSIDVSYSHVRVNTWKAGDLKANHVKECVLNAVNNIALDSNSSNVIVNALNGSGVLSGSFGQLSISNIGASFGSLNIILENSDMVLSLPNTAFNFNLSGDRNDVFIPNNLETKSTKSGSTEIINGYHRSRNTPNIITIAAKYSDVVLK